MSPLDVRRRLVVALVPLVPLVPLALLAAALAASGCGESASAAAGARGGSRAGGGDFGEALPVSVARVERRDMPVRLRAVGRAEPIASVELKPQVEGRVVAVRFTEGDEVAAGQVLLELDDRPFQARLQAAQANAASDEAMARDAQLTLQQLQRVEDLMSEREVQRAQANADAAQAALLSHQAEVALARLEVEYCTIRAPFAGRTGSLSVRVGSVVKADETTLVTLNQLAPIRVAFSVPEQELSEIRLRQASAPLAVEVRRDGLPPETGRLSFIDNAVDRSTGTVRLMATFDNTDHGLWPGQFVEVLLTVSLETAALVVPTHAVQAGQGGAFVYVLLPDQTVEQRAVTVARSMDGESVIAEGLAGDETVVTEGQLRLGPGARVTIAP